MYQREPQAQPTDQPADPAAPLNPAPLSARQLHALCRTVARHLLRGLPRSAYELSRWRQRASAAASPQLRQQALAAIATKRPQSEGAALFATIPRRHDRGLLSLLVAYQLIWDYLDSVHETQPDLANGICLHQALRDAYEPHAPLHDYYQQHHHQHDDGRYLHTLTLHCRENATRLASYDLIQPTLRQQAAGSAHALSINHQPDATQRHAQMRSWAARHSSQEPATWFELTAAAAAALGIFALLAEATHPTCTKHDLDSITAAYQPWACSAATMLDSYADQDQDKENDQHIYIDYYPTSDIAINQTARLIRHSLTRTKTLPRGNTHTVILTSMVAMYLTRNSSRTPTKRPTTTQLAQAGGTLTHILIPILRIWRTLNQLGPA